MSIPLWSLLGFAAWTVGLLALAVGGYRWIRILGGRAGIADFPGDDFHGGDFYHRAMRAHANCIENLPVFAVVVAVLQATGTAAPWIDATCIAIVAARVVQSTVHLSTAQTDRVVAVRFSFFMLQLCGFVVLGACAALRAA